MSYLTLFVEWELQPTPMHSTSWPRGAFAALHQEYVMNISYFGNLSCPGLVPEVLAEYWESGL